MASIHNWVKYSDTCAHAFCGMIHHFMFANINKIITIVIFLLYVIIIFNFKCNIFSYSYYISCY
jgi:hypothetical protein